MAGSCPTDEQLEAYASAPGDDEKAVAVGAHVRLCEVCQCRLRELDVDESLARAAKRAMDVTVGVDGLETKSVESPTAFSLIVGQYHLTRVIASGGMGTVYEAVQQSPRRTVAVKVIRNGIPSRSAMRRFVHESQILARLRHPAIAQVFEAGIHTGPDGEVPFFAMEYIPGARSLTDFASGKKLGTRERLALFAQVCDGAHHGHQKGVIHRDLKPSNILVDNDGQLKIIDFGVARSTDSDLAVTTLQTEVGQLVGTLQYMSPEQCHADPHDIDVRSDVYALGVVLYELLSGKPPYDVSRVPVYEATRVIREQEPGRLSTLDRTLRGELETIVLKALEKDRERRYQSAAEMGDDIRRYLAGEGISARPPSLAYQLRVFARRHRTLVGATACLFLVLSAALVVTSVLYGRAERARILAEQGQAEARSVTAFLTNTLSSIEPAKARGREITVREMVDKAAVEIESGFPHEPLVEATLRSTLGETYRALAEYAQAEKHLRKAMELRKAHLPENSLPVAESYWRLGTLFRNKTEYEEAESFHLKALNIRRAFPEGQADLAESLNDLGLVMVERGRYAQAEVILREALVIRERDGSSGPLVAETLINLALCLNGAGHYGLVDEFQNRALRILRAQFGELHPHVATVLGNIGGMKADTGDYKAAQERLRESIDIKRRIYPGGHASLASSLTTLGRVLIKMKEYAEAESLLNESLRMYANLFENPPLHAAAPRSWLAELNQLRGDHARAIELLEQAYEIEKDRLGADHRDVRRREADLAMQRALAAEAKQNAADIQPSQSPD